MVGLFRSLVINVRISNNKGRIYVFIIFRTIVRYFNVIILQLDLFFICNLSINRPSPTIQNKKENI